MLLLDEAPGASASDQDHSGSSSAASQSRDSNRWEFSSSSLSETSPAPMLAPPPSCPQSCPPDAPCPELDHAATSKRSLKPPHMRRNIKKLLKENQLNVVTKAAQLEELDRLQRLQQQRRDLGNLVGETRGSESLQTTNGSETSVLQLSAPEREYGVTPCVRESDRGHVKSAAAHVADAFNQLDAQGRVLVNVNHPAGESDIYLSPQICRAVRPHQIGGIRFLYDNLVESLDRFKNTAGLGCILAHSMGLGKTLQVIAFIDVLLRHVGAHTVLAIVPVNTLQNWLAEFNLWVPPPEALPPDTHPDYITPRTFKVHILNDEHKTTGSRAKVIEDWYREGGVLLMGYEMYRILSMKKSFVNSRKKKNCKAHEPLVHTDEEDHQQELLTGTEAALARPGPDVVVCDEGHRIKNWHASTSRALKAIGTRRRLVLTGYPLQNNLQEYWCMVDFVRPGFLGTRSEFSNMFERPILNGQCVDSTPEDMTLMRYRGHVLHGLLQGFVQRRGHDVLFSQLPRKQEHVILVRLSALQRRLYTEFMNRFREAGNTGWFHLNPLRAFCVCCKIWNHPDVLFEALQRENMATEQDLDLDDVSASNNRCSTASQRAKAGESVTSEGGLSLSQLQEKASQSITYEWAKDIMAGYKPGILENSAKMLLLFHIIDESVKNKDKVLVFSQSLSTLSVIEEFLMKRQMPDYNGDGIQSNWVRNINYYRLDGSTSVSEREKMINQFNDASNRTAWVFLLSTRAGCLGINLIGASRVVVFDASWNPCHDAQAVCRVYRYGQRKPCHIYRLVCDFTLEKKIYDRQISKQGMSDRVIDDLNPVLNFTRREVESLLHFVQEECSPISSAQLVCPQEDMDSVLKTACERYPHLITKQPFHHESLLMERQDLKLTDEEKEAARKSYEDEKRASVPYTRPSYAHYYPASDQSLSNIPAFSQKNWRPPSQPQKKPAVTVPPAEGPPIHQREGSCISSVSSGGKSLNNFPVTYLQKAGVSVQKIVTTTDIVIPGTNSSSDVQTKISVGESIHIIRGTKGTYIRTSDGRIFAIRAVRKTRQNEEKKEQSASPDINQKVNGGMAYDDVPMLLLSPDEPKIPNELQHFTKESPKMGSLEATSRNQSNGSSSDVDLPLDLRGTKRRSTPSLFVDSSPKQPAVESRALALPPAPNHLITSRSMKPSISLTAPSPHRSSQNSMWSPYFQPQVHTAEPRHVLALDSLRSEPLHSSSLSYLNAAATTSSFTSITESSLRPEPAGVQQSRFPRFGQPLGNYASSMMPGGTSDPADSPFLPYYASLSPQDDQLRHAANTNPAGCGVKSPLFSTDDDIIPVIDQ